MKIKSYAKINLILDVLNKRADGYHNIDFLMTCIDLYDEVEIKRASQDKVVVLDHPEIKSEDNLGFKALKLIKDKKGLENSYEIIIKKNIPICAGMGGGSSNAMSVLKGVAQLENIKVDDEELIEMGIEIGSDVPFFVHSKLSQVRGKGEELEVIDKDIPKSSVLVINSQKPLSTKKVYENYKYKDKSREKIKEILKIKDYDTFYNNLRNDLEEAALEIDSSISELKKDIENNFDVVKILLSGSGPTILVFDKIDRLSEIKEYIKNKYSNYYIQIHKML